MLELIRNTIFLFMLGLVSGQDCEDNATGAFNAMGGCATVLGWGMGCDQLFAGVPIGEECPLSCDNCPADCENNGPTSHGCCLPDINLYINEDGKVYFNSSEDIAGFQFTVQGATVLGVSGGEAGAAGFTLQGNAETGIVLGFSLTGATFGDCGTMIVVELDGTPTGLSGVIVSNPSGDDMGFEYYGVGLR